MVARMQLQQWHFHLCIISEPLIYFRELRHIENKKFSAMFMCKDVFQEKVMSPVLIFCTRFKHAKKFPDLDI